MVSAFVRGAVITIALLILAVQGLKQIPELFPTKIRQETRQETGK